MPAERARYQVSIDRDAQRVLKRCPADLVRRLRAAILALADNPRPIGCKKLTGQYDLWRIRVGDWRIVYQIQDDVLIVVVVEVASRGNAYRKLQGGTR